MAKNKGKGKGKGKGGHKPKPLKPVKRRVVTRHGRAANPGQLEDAVNPYLTGDQEMEGTDKETGWRDDLDSLNDNFIQQFAALPGTLDEISKSAARSADSANSDAISRGVFSSSIRDTAIGDVEAQRASETTNAKNLVTAAQQAYTTRKNQIEGVGGERYRFNVGQLGRATDNARQDNADRDWVVQPTEAVEEESKTVNDYAPGTPGIQTRAQAMKIRKNRQANKPGSSKPAGAGRGNLRGRPNRPGKPRSIQGRI